ncbi:MAG: tetraacyldisaccharide 4'-kinase [Candidatus Omnitrophota bacterium]|nr:tetraacyldisaccharide 4'-kinase [Candidatus Omnitrophota bacterium]
MLSYLYSLAQDEKKGVVAGLLKAFLSFLSFIYIFCLALAKKGYGLGILYSCRLNCKVISVGNITLGGTGKTPFVRMLAKYLTADGHKVAILIRGYKRKMRNAECGMRNAEIMGDEGYYLAKDTGLPVLVGANRVQTGREACEKYHPDIVILDDGFQHWRLSRDLDVVLINALNPFGNNKVIPRGILREPFRSLKRADIFVLTKTDLAPDTQGLKNKLSLINPGALIVEAVHKPVCLVDSKGNSLELVNLRNKEVCIFSAIADPVSFAQILLGLGAKIKHKYEFSDHHNYTKGDLSTILNECKVLGVTTLITTEKDSVKLESLVSGLPIEILALRIELVIIKNEQEFHSRLSRI